MTLPLKDHEVVFGKYLAALAFLSFTILLSFPLLLIVRAMGSPDLGPIVGGYAGTLLLGAAFLAIGIFISSLTENQIIAFIVAFVVAFFLQILDADVVLTSVPEAVAPLVGFLGASGHFESIERGVIDSRDLLYFASVIAFFLYLNVRTIESRKWA
jgi:ABC-2 type transport system permease protein